MMLKKIEKRKPTCVPSVDSLKAQGYRFFYRHGQTNHCPSCTRTAWYVGRTSAECSNCGGVLEFPESSHSSTRVVARRPKWQEFVLQR